MTISIQGTRLDLTDTIRAMVEEKLSDALTPLGSADLAPIHVAIELENTTMRYRERDDARDFRAEATVTGYGPTVRAEGAADSLESAVVAMKRTLSRQLRDERERRRDAQRAGARVIHPRT